MQIAIFGTGYVGLVTGSCFAEMGHIVTCVDIDKKKVDLLLKGQVPFYEPGIEELVKRNIEAKRLFFTTDYAKAIEHSNLCFIAVPTPSKENGSCDLSFIFSCAQNIAKNLNKSYIIVNKSTAPVGTCDFIYKTVEEELKKRNLSISFDVASNPEFLKEGSAIQDCMKPDRIILGTKKKATEDLLKQIYTPFTLSHDRVFVMDTKSAEMTKYAANAMLATRISFMNEIAGICTQVGANVNEVRKGIGSDKRIGYSFLYAGIGYGGSCFPKDIRALLSLGKAHGSSCDLLQSVEIVNQRQKELLAKAIEKYFVSQNGLEGKTIGIWGLSFKPDTDDMRDAPSLILIKKLLAKKVKLKLFDPVAMENAKKLLSGEKNITWCKDEFEAAKDTDAIALLTEWKQFRLLDFVPIKKSMKGKAFFDGRNQYHSEEMKNKGFDYVGIGLPQTFEEEN